MIQTLPPPDPTQSPTEYLEDALAAAEGELRRQFSFVEFQAIARIAHELVALRVGLISSTPSNPVEVEFLRKFVPGLDPELLRKNALHLPNDPAEWPPWIRYTVEFILMERAVDRIQDFGGRYRDLRASMVDRVIPENIDSLIDEVISLYMWGFDRPAIGMACGCFERIARTALLALGHVTEPQLQRERPAAGELRSRLRQAGLLERSSLDADYLIRQRNAVLHDTLAEGESLPETSRKCIAALLQVADELHPTWPRA